MKWYGLITRWTMHGPLTTQRDSELTLESTLKPVWLNQRPVVQQVVPSVCGWGWLIVHQLLEFSHLISREQQDHVSTAQVATSGTIHMYYQYIHINWKCVINVEFLMNGQVWLWLFNLIFGGHQSFVIPLFDVKCATVSK